MSQKLEQEELFDDSDYEAAFNSAAETEGETELVEEQGEEQGEEQAQSDDNEQETASESETTTSPDIANIEAQLAKMENLLAEAAKRAPAVPAADTKPEKSQDDVDDEEALSEVQQDWPTIYRAMEARIKQLEKQLTDKVTGIEAKIKGDFAPLTQVVTETAQEKFLATIVTAHPDSTQLLPEVEKWIDQQPTFLRAAYNNALDNGTAKEVIELYDTFKKATGRTEMSNQDDKKQEEQQRQKRLRQMEGVKSERTSATALDEDDFEGAFNRAARS